MIKLSIYGLKPAFQRKLSPLMILFHSWGISPNFLTGLTCFLSILMGFFLFHSGKAEYFLFLPFFFLFRMAMNALDGMLASEFKLQSKLGAYLNEVCDVISDVALYVPFLAIDIFFKVSFFVLIALSLITEFAGLALIAAGEKRGFQGPFGKSDRALYFSILAILVSTGYADHKTYSLFIISGIVLSLMTVWNRGSSLK